jgi:protein-tyrosine phosphatase
MMRVPRLLRTIGLFLVVLLICTALFIRFQGNKHYPSTMSTVLESTDVVSVQSGNTDTLNIRWVEGADTTRVYSGNRPEDIRTDAEPIAQVYGRNRHEVSVANTPGTVRKYFSICFDGGRYDQKCFVAAQREVAIEGAANFRDVGGYPTRDGHFIRWGQFYRSANLGGITQKGLQQLAGLQVRTVYDLRYDEEAASEPDRLPPGVSYCRIPIYQKTGEPGGLATVLFRYKLESHWLNFYERTLVDESGEAYGKLFRDLAYDAQYPVVLHCSSGKDRAGVFTALLLSTLGVPDETIVSDYSLSNKYYKQVLDYAKKRMEQHKFLKALNIQAEDLYPFYVADPKVIIATMAYINRRYGSCGAYLHDKAGVDDLMAQALRRKLLNQ